VRVRVYVCVVKLSEPVTTMVTIFVPTFIGILADAVPDVTVVPLTVTVAEGSLVVGVMVMDANIMVAE